MSEWTRGAEQWLPGLIRDRWNRWRDAGPPVSHVWLTIADHYEPYWQRPDDSTAQARVAAWFDGWPRIASRFHDCRGAPARYTFFYAQEEYRAELLAPLADLTRSGVADVEVHIHHDGEGEADFLSRMRGFITALRQDHGLLRDRDGRPTFGFIHGNWSLDNSRPDGRWCGLNNELTLLRELGCYADFTLPAAPDPCQTRRVNSIYWAVDNPEAPKSHDDGIPVTPGGTAPPEALLMVQGPLGVRWPRERWPRPALEVGELAGNNPVTPGRVASWLDCAPRLGGHVFVKLHTHGAPEKNAGPLLERDLDRVFTLVHQQAAERGWQVVHATAWDVVRGIEALIAGGSPLAAIDHDAERGQEAPELT